MSIEAQELYTDWSVHACRSTYLTDYCFPWTLPQPPGDSETETLAQSTARLRLLPAVLVNRFSPYWFLSSWQGNQGCAPAVPSFKLINLQTCIGQESAASISLKSVYYRNIINICLLIMRLSWSALLCTTFQILTIYRVNAISRKLWPSWYGHPPQGVFLQYCIYITY